jgi:hypothetical protein
MQLETEQKALEINLDPAIYGAFAEIGAGQEVARYFFQAGAAAGTIAKTVSAYDKIVSDAIYGDEPSGRYVCESRLYKMLDHEFGLMQERLRPCRESCNFFAFADTVSALNYQKTVRGDGWMGLRFQRSPDRAPNDLVLHARLLDPDNRQQQQAVGILGVNMIYACFRYQNDPEKLVKSLLDGLRGRVSVDMIRLSGPDFADLDNRLLSLYLVKNGLSDVAIFGCDGRSLHASEFLYKKSILIARGSFRPPTRLQQDMILKSFAQFQAEPDIDAAKSTYLCEITLDNLMSSGQLDEKDFLDRADLLCALDQTVLISSCVQHKKLISYFADYKIHRIGLAMGVKKLSNIIQETYQQNLDNLLAAFGQIFLRHVKFYIYPALVRDDQPDLMTIENMPVPESITFLFKHLVETGHIADIEDFSPDFLHIYHKKVLQKIQSGSDDWETEVPRRVAKLIREKALFGFLKK